MSSTISIDYIMKAISEERAYTVSSSLVNIPTSSEHPLILLRNPSNSGKPMLVSHFAFGTDSANTRSIFKIYQQPTVTADGSAMTIVNTYVKAGARSPIAEAYVNPTVSDNGQQLNMIIGPGDSPSRGLNRWYWIDPGYEILVTIENSQANVSSFADVYWVEGF